MEGFGKGECPQCSGHYEFSMAALGEQIPCPHCSQPLVLASSSQTAPRGNSGIPPQVPVERIVPTPLNSPASLMNPLAAPLTRRPVLAGGALICLLVGVSIIGWFADNSSRNSSANQTRGSSNPQEVPSTTPMAAQPEPATASPWPETQSLDLGGGVTMEFVLVRPGWFMMGSDSGVLDGKPIHKVTLTTPFYLGKFEVTQAQWQKVMGNNPSNFKGPNRPVESVSWNDCQNFLAKLQVKAGRKFALPTEAQWEYACRAGTTTRYSFPDNDSSRAEYAWFDTNSGDTTHPVGEKKPNPWGLFDMHGNVMEWCADWHDTYPNGDATNPLGASSGDTRVMRGGAWLGNANLLGSASRLSLEPNDREYAVGLRCVLVVDEASLSGSGNPLEETRQPGNAMTVGITNTPSQPKITPQARFQESKAKAEQGDAASQNYLGSCYYNGQGVPKNEVEAVRWFRKAAEQNHVQAQFNLGVYCVASGRRINIANKFRETATERQRYTEAISWFRKAAEQNDAEAQCQLGVHYDVGLGVARDTVEAVRWFRKAAEQNNTQAQIYLGNYFKRVARDPVEAVEWYRKAAEQNNAQAQENLADCYAFGLGVARDYTEAYAWYCLAGNVNRANSPGYSNTTKMMSMYPQKVAAAQRRIKELRAQIDAKLKADTK